LQLWPHRKLMPTSDSQLNSMLLKFVTQPFFLF
jgi:hypothetical protein